MYLNLKQYGFADDNTLPAFDRQRVVFFEIADFLARLSPSRVNGWTGKSFEKCDDCHIEFLNPEYALRWSYGRIHLSIPDDEEVHTLFILQFGEHRWS